MLERVLHSRPAFSRRKVFRMLAVMCIALASTGGFIHAQGQAAATSSMPTVRLLARPSAATPSAIGAGDLVDIQVFNTPELSARRRVGSEGSISLPGTGEVMLAGLTPLQAGGVIEKSLRDAQIMLDPHVSVTVIEFTTDGITVLGEVKSPGTYSLLGEQSLYSALAAAGGVTQHQGSSITVTHKTDPAHPHIVQVSSASYSAEQQSTAVVPGDIVFVSQAGAIYVVGDVTHPGEFFLSNGQPLRALNALALADGLKDSAAPEKASIIRRTDDGAETIPVDLKRVSKNAALDPVLLPSDILVVPRSGLRTFLNTALPGASNAVLNAAALALVYR